jgi:hypothetical protein
MTKKTKIKLFINKKSIKRHLKLQFFFLSLFATRTGFQVLLVPDKLI